MLCGDREVSVKAGSGRRAVPEILLNEAEVEAGLKEMSRERSDAAYARKRVC